MGGWFEPAVGAAPENVVSLFAASLVIHEAFTVTSSED